MTWPEAVVNTAEALSAVGIAWAVTWGVVKLFGIFFSDFFSD